MLFGTTSLHIAAGVLHPFTVRQGKRAEATNRRRSNVRKAKGGTPPPLSAWSCKKKSTLPHLNHKYGLTLSSSSHLADLKSSSVSRFRCNAAEVFLNSVEKSNRISRYLGQAADEKRGKARIDNIVPTERLQPTSHRDTCAVVVKQIGRTHVVFSRRIDGPFRKKGAVAKVCGTRLAAC